jgi:hypothetical protein
MILNYCALFEPRPKSSRPVAQIDTIVIHRIELTRLARPRFPTPAEFASEFRDTSAGAPGHGLGGGPSYSFVVTADGFVWQFAPLSQRTTHAKGHNSHSIGIACMGDFNKAQPTQVQWDALANLCADLNAMLDRDVTIRGHTDTPGWSADDSKVCPGKLMPVGILREAVRGKLLSRPRGVVPDGLVL